MLSKLLDTSSQKNTQILSVYVQLLRKLPWEAPLYYPTILYKRFVARETEALEHLRQRGREAILSLVYWKFMRNAANGSLWMKTGIFNGFAVAVSSEQEA